MTANISQLGNFGDIAFEVSDKKLLGFEGFSRDMSSRYENHALIGQKPRTEFIAPELDTITFTVHLKSLFGVNPRQEIERWEEYLKTGKPAKLSIGGKFIGADSWVVLNMSQKWDLIYSRGELISAKINITLQEYISDMWTTRAQEENRRREIELLKAQL